MSEILSVGSRSLLAIQQALNTTGHNIANANTEGYSRQSVNFVAAPSQQLGFGYLGKGVEIQSIERSYDSFLTGQVRNFVSSQSQYEVFSAMSSRVDGIMANTSSSLNTSIQQFFSAVQDVANSPSTLPERQALIGQATNLVDRFQNFSGLLADLNDEININLRSVVTEVNGLADSLAVLNGEIVSARLSTNSSSPNDLLDQRDRLLKELAAKVSVTTIEGADGGVSVFIGRGQALVVGTETTHLQTQIDPYDSSKLNIGIAGQSSVVPVNAFLNGGELQGLLDFRNRVLDPVQAELGLVMLGLGETVNAQHRLGMDLNDQTGGDFFSTGGIFPRAHTANGGSAIPAVSLTDVGQLRASDYLLNFDGTQWHLTRKSDNTSVSGAGPLSLDGMTVDLSAGVPAAGDSFLLKPSRDAANTLDLAVTDPRKIAAADLVSATVTGSNLGNGRLEDLTVDPVNGLPVGAPITLTFNPDALGPGVPGFDVVGGPGGTLGYDPATENGGKTFVFPAEGFSFTVADFPEAGDSFVIGDNTGAHGDNGNMLKIAALQSNSVLNGGQDTYQELYGAMVAGVGVVNQQAQSNLQMENSLLEQASSYKENASGVNLDEEAANMLRFQQQYQAAAQLIKVADEMFQSLLNSIR